jgi:hypothetical protein
LSWHLSEHPLDENCVYTLSGVCLKENSGELLLQSTEEWINRPGDWIDGLSADLARGQLTFRTLTNLQHFREVALDPEKRKHCSIIVEIRPSNAACPAILAKFGFWACRGNGEAQIGQIHSGMSINGMKGAVILVDDNGEPLSVDGQTIKIPTSGGSGEQNGPDQDGVDSLNGATDALNIVDYNGNPYVVSNQNISIPALTNPNPQAIGMLEIDTATNAYNRGIHLFSNSVANSHSYFRVGSNGWLVISRRNDDSAESINWGANVEFAALNLTNTINVANEVTAKTFRQAAGVAIQANGYCRLFNSLYLQWGRANPIGQGTTISDDDLASGGIPFPISFPNACLAMTAGRVPDSAAGSNASQVLMLRYTAQKFLGRYPGQNYGSFDWIAIGY